MQDRLFGAIDLHVHGAPDVRPRKMDVMELALTAKDSGMRALLVKNHHLPTVEIANLLTSKLRFNVFGGIALNEWIGGLNPYAVEAALNLGAAEVWMPTLSSAHEREYRGYKGTGITVLDENGDLRQEVIEIIKLIAEREIILGLGHLSTKEMFQLLKMGTRLGIRRFLVNHPEINFLNLSPSIQKEFTAFPGVYFERCYVRANSAVDWDGLARVIRTVGVNSTVLATDLGQASNPDPFTGMREMLKEMTARDFTAEEIQTMVSINPGFLLKL
jgi:hypothetical protein